MAREYKEAHLKKLPLLFAIYERFLLIYYLKNFEVYCLIWELELLIYFQLNDYLLLWEREFIY